MRFPEYRENNSEVFRIRRGFGDFRRRLCSRFSAMCANSPSHGTRKLIHRNSEINPPEQRNLLARTGNGPSEGRRRWSRNRIRLPWLRVAAGRRRRGPQTPLGLLPEMSRPPAGVPRSAASAAPAASRRICPRDRWCVAPSAHTRLQTSGNRRQRYPWPVPSVRWYPPVKRGSARPVPVPGSGGDRRRENWVTAG